MVINFANWNTELFLINLLIYNLLQKYNTYILLET
jgi:hypothetical protein